MNEQQVNSHQEAMRLAGEAFVMRIQGQSENAHQLTAQAFKKEREAALSVLSLIDLEPTRSVLFRSAASLAIECQEYREAEKLVCAGLYGNPPEEIAEELRDLLEVVHFNRHLSLKDIKISSNEFQLSLTGDSVGFGTARAAEYYPRIKSIESLVYRTEERRRELPFRGSGPPKKELKNDLELYVSAPRAASFAVTLQLGVSPMLPGMGFSDALIDDMFTSFELFNESDLDSLKGHISNESYLQHFVGMAKIIAPDGENIKSVNFTSIRDGSEKSISLTTTRSESLKIKQSETPGTKSLKSKTSKKKKVKIHGRLFWLSCNSRGQELYLVSSCIHYL